METSLNMAALQDWSQEWNIPHANTTCSYAPGKLPRDTFSKLFVIAISGIIPIYSVPPSTKYALLIGFFLWRYIWNDYQEHIALGQPPTTTGFLGAKFQTLFKLNNTHTPPKVPGALLPQVGFLGDKLPNCSGTRPIVKGLSPQRQITQLARNQPEMSNKTNNMLADFLEERNPYLKRLSTIADLSKDIIALAVKRTCSSHRLNQREFCLEIAHPHENGGSLQVTLHPDDVRAVLESGFGERHSLARSEWWWKFFWVYLYRKDSWITEMWGWRGRRPVSEGAVFIYAPRNDQELEVVKQILSAACWYVAGKSEPEPSMEMTAAEGVFGPSNLPPISYSSNMLSSLSIVGL